MLRSKVDYSVGKGLIEMLCALTDLGKHEVWWQLSEYAEICVERIAKKGIGESWCWKTFPNTEIRVKVKVYNNGSEDAHWCEIKMDANDSDEFTSDEVENFIDDILLGEDEDVIPE